jgi:hypothetical protein
VLKAEASGGRGRSRVVTLNLGREDVHVLSA